MFNDVHVQHFNTVGYAMTYSDSIYHVKYCSHVLKVFRKWGFELTMVTLYTFNTDSQRQQTMNQITMHLHSISLLSSHWYLI